jgi:hypothetical protein
MVLPAVTGPDGTVPTVPVSISLLFAVTLFVQALGTDTAPAELVNTSVLKAASPRTSSPAFLWRLIISLSVIDEMARS